METINVKDLPEPVARAIAMIVDTLREQLRADERRKVVVFWSDYLSLIRR